jgi:quercetin dioxygenase-like cupin family protein
MNPVSTTTAKHYVWGEVCDGWHLLEGQDLSVIEERVPPGAGEQRHRHHYARQFFYVLSGVANLELEGKVHRLATGDGLHVPPLASHQLRNESDLELRFLVISAPHAHGDREATP